MFVQHRSHLLAVSLFVLALMARPAAAQFAYTGDTTGATTYRRANASYPVSGVSFTATAVPYSSYVFTPTTSGTYQFLSTTTPNTYPNASWDNLTFLYSGSGFNTATPSLNALAVNDEYVDSLYDPLLTRQKGKSGFRFDLTAGSTYTFVTTGFNNAAFGAFSNTIDLLNVAPKQLFSGTIPTTGNTFTRPTIGLNGSLPSSLSSQVVGYSVVNFTVPQDGLYDVVGQSSVPNNGNAPYSFLYQNGFDPASPLTNIIGGNDFYNATQGLSGFGKFLTANTNYSLVMANQFSFSSGGAYTAYVQGIVVPEMGTLWLVGAALGAGLVGRKVRRSVK